MRNRDPGRFGFFKRLCWYCLSEQLFVCSARLSFRLLHPSQIRCLREECLLQVPLIGDERALGWVDNNTVAPNAPSVTVFSIRHSFWKNLLVTLWCCCSSVFLNSVCAKQNFKIKPWHYMLCANMCTWYIFMSLVSEEMNCSFSKWSQPIMHSTNVGRGGGISESVRNTLLIPEGNLQSYRSTDIIVLGVSKLIEIVQ